MNAPTNMRDRDFIPTWSLNFTKLVRTQRNFMEKGETFLRCNMSDGVHLQCTSTTHVVDKEDIIIRWGEWDKGAFRAIHVESDPEEPLVSSEDEG